MNKYTETLEERFPLGSRVYVRDLPESAYPYGDVIGYSTEGKIVVDRTPKGTVTTQDPDDLILIEEEGAPSVQSVLIGFVLILLLIGLIVGLGSGPIWPFSEV